MGRPLRSGLVTCIRCEREYPRTNEYFPYRNKEKGYLSSWCKTCHKQHKAIPDVKKVALEKQMVRRKAQRGCHACRAASVGIGCRYCGPCAKLLRTEKKRYEKAIYKGRMRRATPPWANKFFIAEIYDLARLRTKILGIPFHVDHVVPIRGVGVSGLHVHENLQILPGEVNQRKSNHYSLEFAGVK